MAINRSLSIPESLDAQIMEHLKKLNSESTFEISFNNFMLGCAKKEINYKGEKK